MLSTYFYCCVKNTRQFRLVYILTISLLVVLCSSCTKQQTVESNYAVLHVVGAISNGEYVVTSFKGTQPLEYYRTASRIGTYQSGDFPRKYFISDPQQPLAFYAFPDTLPGSKPVLNLNLELEMDEAYTLFLAGSSGSLDTMLIKETIPAISNADSVTAVRFVNLCNAGPISVNLKGEPEGSAVQNLPYMDITAYKFYPVRHNISTYEFEIRDAVTGDLLFTYTGANVNGNGGKHEWLGRSRTHVLVGTRGVTTGADRINIRPFTL